MKVRKDILPHARKNRKKTNAAYSEMMAQYHTEAQGDASKKVNDTMDNIIDIRLWTISSFCFIFYKYIYLNGNWFVGSMMCPITFVSLSIWISVWACGTRLSSKDRKLFQSLDDRT